ncbi:MAG: conjugal transfer protein TraB [Chromatiales bacterium 21-64-14]|nr:MAG: conjugal transfer protein TraB [Chromatiales bacterium 21-64-14]HQU16477.1 TraB/GumN family protein [Gammaproteobacteria bacterium]
MPPSANREPLVQMELGGRRITLLGTAHVSRASAAKVEALLATGDYDAVAVELCPSRYQALINPDTFAGLDLIKTLRNGKASMVTANLALSAYQQRLAEQFDIRPGEEMRTAVETAQGAGLPVLLIDREIGTTLTRVYRNVPWWRRLYLISGLIASVITREKVTEAEIERLKEGDMLESIFAQFADQARELYVPLIEERDRYMAARLSDEMKTARPAHLLAVIGAGHLKGIEHHLLNADPDTRGVIAALDQVPAPSPWPKLLPWMIVGLIVLGFALGFYRSPALGWRLVTEWVLINGILAAMGAGIAGGHPLTVATGFVAAPITSLNPMIGAGMVTATVEAWLRKPTVGDFSRLRSDTAHWKGWWRNRVARTLLVFLLSTLGSAVGTYLAGFRIFQHLMGGG